MFFHELIVVHSGPSVVPHEEAGHGTYLYAALSVTDNIVGKGGYAHVYKGTLADGSLIAVKKLTKGETEEEKEHFFLTELGIVSHVSHPNANELIGFCIEGGLHLVFRFSHNGSLATFLYGKSRYFQDGTLCAFWWTVRSKLRMIEIPTRTYDGSEDVTRCRIEAPGARVVCKVQDGSRRCSWFAVLT